MKIRYEECWGNRVWIMESVEIIREIDFSLQV